MASVLVIFISSHRDSWWGGSYGGGFIRIHVRTRDVMEFQDKDPCHGIIERVEACPEFKIAGRPLAPMFYINVILVLSEFIFLCLNFCPSLF